MTKRLLTTLVLTLSFLASGPADASHQRVKRGGVIKPSGRATAPILKVRAKKSGDSIVMTMGRFKIFQGGQKADVSFSGQKQVESNFAGLRLTLRNTGVAAVYRQLIVPGKNIITSLAASPFLDADVIDALHRHGDGDVSDFHDLLDSQIQKHEGGLSITSRNRVTVKSTTQEGDGFVVESSLDLNPGESLDAVETDDVGWELENESPNQ